MENTTTQVSTLEPIRNPRSAARDAMGFSQKENFELIQGEYLYENWLNFRKIWHSIQDGENPLNIFTQHTQTFLLKKVDNPQ
jgi:hypothetical protein